MKKVLNYGEKIKYNVHEHWLLSGMFFWSRTLYHKREVNARFILDFPKNQGLYSIYSNKKQVVFDTTDTKKEVFL